MSTRKIAVVSAGLSQPSSTRLLADRLAQAATAELGERGITAEVATYELRDLAHEITNAMLTGFPTGDLREALEAVTGADAVLHLTEWEEFRALDPAALGEKVRRRLVVDGRNCLDREAYRAAGWTYLGLGRP